MTDFTRRNSADADKKLAALAVVEGGDTIFYPLTSLFIGVPCASVSVAAAANTTLVAATPGKRVYVFAVKLLAEGASTTVQFKSDTTAIEGGQTYASGSGFCEAVTPPAFLFATAVGEALKLDVTGSARGRVSYWIGD